MTGAGARAGAVGAAGDVGVRMLLVYLASRWRLVVHLRPTAAAAALVSLSVFDRKASMQL